MLKRRSEEISTEKTGEKEPSKTKEAGKVEEPKKLKLAFTLDKKSSDPLKQDSEEPGKLVKRKPTLKEVFNSDSESEEEMPKEARMRMRNMGRDTPTSAGPNSFGKTKHGFCDAKKVFEKSLRVAADNLSAN